MKTAALVKTSKLLTVLLALTTAVALLTGPSPFPSCTAPSTTSRSARWSWRSARG